MPFQLQTLVQPRSIAAVTQSNENSLSDRQAGSSWVVHCAGRIPFSVSISGTSRLHNSAFLLQTRNLPRQTNIILALSFLAGRRSSQTNANAEGISALTVAYAGDVSVTSKATPRPALNGVNALSQATAAATASSNVAQTNSNSLTAATEGDMGSTTIPFVLTGTSTNATVCACRWSASQSGRYRCHSAVPLPAFVVQNQDVEQTNFNLQGLAATSIATAGDVTVTREGDTAAGADGINATSYASATSAVDSSVAQTNTNTASATTSGEAAAILQGPFEPYGPDTSYPYPWILTSRQSDHLT